MYFPRVFIEVTNFCNLSCVYCPYVTQNRKRQFMDFGLFKKIIDDLFENHQTDRIDFHILGEPLLHKDFFEMVSYIKRKAGNGVTLALATNGILLSNESIRENLLNSELDVIGISVRAQDEPEFELKLPRVSEDNADVVLAKYQENIEAIRTFVRDHHERKSRILLSLGYFHTVNSPFNIVFSYPFIRRRAQIRKIVRFWHEVIEHYEGTIPLKKVKTPFSLKASQSYENNVMLSDKLELRIEKIGLWHNQLISDEYFISEASEGECVLYPNLTIASDGRVLGCCLDYNGEITWGSLVGATIEEVFSSKKYNVFRENMDVGRITHPVCKRCLGTVCEKKTGKSVVPEQSRLVRFFYLLVDNPGAFLKKFCDRILFQRQKKLE